MGPGSRAEAAPAGTSRSTCSEVDLRGGTLRRMADYTSVGAHLSVGSDPAPDATANFDLVVLAAKECQHDGDAFPTEVLRCPLTDGGAEPTTAEVKKAQAIPVEFVSLLKVSELEEQACLSIPSFNLVD